MRSAVTWLLCVLLAIGDVAATLAAVPPAAAVAPGAAAIAGQPAAPLPIGFDDLFRFHARSVEVGGSLVLGFQDVSIPARGAPLALARFYRSDLAVDTGLGRGWGWSFGVRLRVNDITGAPEIIEESGRVSSYEWRSDNQAQAVSGRLDSILARQGANVVRVFADGGREVFDRGGLLTERWAGGGLAQRIRYEDDLPVEVSDWAGRRLQMAFAGGHLLSVTDPVGRTMRYRHDGEGRLAGTEDALGRRTTFSYDAAGRLAGIGLVDGRMVAVAYGYDDRVAKLTGPSDLETRFSHERSFDDGRLGLTMTDGLGHASSAVFERHDQDTDDPHIAVTITNGMGERTEVELRAGRATIMSPGLPPIIVELDGAGRPVRMVLPDGTVEPVAPPVGSSDAADAASAIVPAYDEFGNPLVETVTSGVLSLEHDAAGRRIATIDSAGHRASLAYDDGDRLLTETDILGQVITNAYDPGDRIVESTDARGNVTRFAYEARGLLEAIEVAGERTFRFRHDPVGRLVELTDGQVGDQYEYDAADRLIARTDQSGNQDRFLYDAAGRLIAFIDDRGRRTDLDPDLVGIAGIIPAAMGETWRTRRIEGGFEITDAAGIVDRLTESSDGLSRLIETPTGRVATEEYDSAGRLIGRQLPGEAAEVWVYDQRGLLVAAGMTGRETRYEYDERGSLVALERPGGQVIRYERDAFGRVVRQTDNHGDDTRFEYDVRGDMAAMTNARGVRTSFLWDGFGRLVREDDGVRAIDYRYDQRGRMVGQGEAGGWNQELVYDSLDRLVERVESAGQISRRWRYTYDRFDQRVEIVLPDGSSQNFERDLDGRILRFEDRGISFDIAYDAAGNLVSMTRSDTDATVAYDGDGRLAALNEPVPRNFSYGAGPWPERVEDGRGATWLQTYDAYGDMASVTDRLGAVTRFERDQAGRLEAAIDHTGRGQGNEHDATGRLIAAGVLDGPGINYSYDEYGDLASTVRADGTTIAYQRDERGRVTVITVDRRPARSFAYDRWGRLATATDELGVHRFAYDEAGNLISETDPFGRTLGRRYDALGRTIAVTAEGKEESYRYSPQGRLDRVVGIDGGETVIGRDPLLRVDRVAYPDGTTAELAYDLDDRPAALRYRNPAGNLLAEQQSEHDAEGEVVAVTAGEGVTRYSYDAESRLTSVTEPDGSAEIYTYDPAGNLVGFGGIGTLAFDQAYRLTAAGGRATRHDATGNLTAIEGLIDLQYDAFGRLQTATAEGGTVNFRYDFLNRLVERSGPSGVVRYQYDGNRLLAAYDEEGRLLDWVERLPEGPGTARLIGDGPTRLVLADALGTPIADLGEDGGVSAVAFSAWGKSVRAAPEYAALVGFTGAPTDPTTGIVALGPRAYLPAIGRFLQPDPAGLVGGVNPYRYAENNPLGFVDRSGLLSLPSFEPPWTGYFELLSRFNAAYDIVSATPSGSGEMGRLPGVNIDRAGNPIGGQGHTVPGMWRGTTVRELGPVPGGYRVDVAPSPGVPGFDTNHFRSHYGHGRVLTDRLGVFDLPGEPPSPERPHGLPPRRLFQVQTPEGVYEYIVTRDGRLTHSLFKPGATIDGYVNREGVGRPPRPGNVYGQRGPIWDRIRGAVERSGRRDFYTEVSRALERYQRIPQATTRAMPTFSRAGSRIIGALERTRLAFPRAFRFVGWAGAALVIYSTIHDFTDPNVSWGQAFGNLAINAALFALPFLGPAGVAIAVAIGAAMLLAALFDWLFNNDPTFITVARGPPKLGSRSRLIVRARGPPAQAEIWLDRPATLNAAVYRADGGLVRNLGTFDAEPGMTAVAWDGTDSGASAAAEGRYLLLIAPVGGSGTAPVRWPVAVDRSVPVIEIGEPEEKDGRVAIAVATEKRATLAWSWLDGDLWRPLGGSGASEAAEFSIGAADVGGREEARLKITALDEAGNLAEAETTVDLPALPPDRVVEILTLKRDLLVERVSAPISVEDRLPHWLAGTIPTGAETVGEWRWEASLADPLGAATHLSRGEGPDLHYLLAPEAGWFLAQQDALVQYLRIDPRAPPRQLAVQLYLETGDGEHRASFGEKLIDFGAVGGTGLVDLGAVPQAGEWLRLSIPATAVGAGGRRVIGVLFAVYGGTATWGTTTTADAGNGAVSITPASATVPSAEVSVRLDLAYRPALAAGELDVALVGDDTEWPVAENIAIAPGPRHLSWTGSASAAERGSLRFRATLPDGTIREQLVSLVGLADGPDLAARIDYPPDGAIGRSQVPIFGQAGGPGFERYVVDLQPVGAPDTEWQTVIESTTPQGISETEIRYALHEFDGAGLRRPISGNLASLQTGSFNYRFAFRPSDQTLPPGRVIVRLRVFGAGGTVAEDRTELVIGELADDRGLAIIPSPDGLARLEIPPLSMPADVGAVAIEPVTVVLNGGTSATGYRLSPAGLTLRSPARLVLPAPEGPAEARLVADDSMSLPIVVVDDGPEWLAVTIDRFPTDGAFMTRPAEAPAPPLVLAPAEPVVGPADLIAEAEPGVRVELRLVPETEPVATATADREGLAFFEAVPLAAGDNRFEAVAVRGDDARSLPGTTTIVAALAPQAAGRIIAWTEVPERLEAGEGARIAVLLEGGPVLVEATASGPDGEQRVRLVRAGREHVGTFVADDQVGTATISLFGESREIAVVDTIGPMAPVAWPAGLPGPAWRGSFAAGDDGALFAGGSMTVADVPTLGLLHRLDPDASATLLLRGDGGTAVVPLAGPVPNLAGSVKLAPAPALSTEGAWHFVSLSLPAMLGDFGGRIDRVELMRSVPLSWSVDGIAEARGITLRDAWLGPAWPAQGPAAITLSYTTDDVAAIEWALDRNLDGPAPDSEPIIIEGRPVELALPTLDGSGVFALHLRARDPAGNWGPWTDTAFLVDREPPRIEAPSPEPNSESAELRASFQVIDQDMGFDVTSLEMSVNGVAVPPAAVRYDPVSRVASVAFGDLPQRPQPDQAGQIAVEITEAVDLAGNRMPEPYRWSWRFDASRVSSGEARLLTTAGGADAAWSPDGSRIAYVSDRDGTADLYELDVAGGSERQLTADAMVESSPSYAEDGRLVFATEAGVVALEPASGDVETIAAGFADPRWSAGAVLAADGNRVVRIDPLSGVATTIVILPDGVTARRPSPAGRRVVFGESIYHESIWAAEPGGAPAPLSSGLDDPALLERDPAADPGGSWVAFAAGGNEPGLWLSDLNGRERSLLVAGRAAQIRRPSWSPDGRRLVFDSDANGVRNLWLLDLGRLPEARAEPPILSYAEGAPMRLEMVLDEPATVTVSVADRDGNALRELRSAAPAADRLSVDWDGRAADGAALPDGRYQFVAAIQRQGPSLTARVPVGIDNSPPTTAAFRASDGRAIGPGVLPAAGEHIVLRASDGALGAGVARIEYRLDDESEWRLFDETVAIAEFGGANLVFRAVDRLDQVEEPQRLDLATGTIGPVAQAEPAPAPQPAPVPASSPAAEVEPPAEYPAWLWIIAALLVLAVGGLSVLVLRRRRPA